MGTTFDFKESGYWNFLSLLVGGQKSINLIEFDPFPMTTLQTTINGFGGLEFQFSVPDDVVFFRLEIQ